MGSALSTSFRSEFRRLLSFLRAGLVEAYRTDSLESEKSDSKAGPLCGLSDLTGASVWSLFAIFKFNGRPTLRVASRVHLNHNQCEGKTFKSHNNEWVRGTFLSRIVGCNSGSGLARSQSHVQRANRQPVGPANGGNERLRGSWLLQWTYHKDIRSRHGI